MEIGAAPFDPGPGHYDDRRAKRKRQREEKAERKRRARAEKLERKRREEAKRRERERREAADKHEREQREAAERRKREHAARLERERTQKLQRERRERLERERAERRERARADHERLRRETELQQQREERLRAERERAERAEAERERVRLAEQKRRQEQRNARERKERERAERERRKREAAVERRHRAELARRRKARERAKKNLDLKPASGTAGPAGPVRLKAVPAARRAPHPRVRKAPAAAVSLRRPTVKAALALVAVTAFATVTGSLLGLPVPLLSGSDESEATLSGDAALTGLLDAGTPPGLTKGPYFPVVLDAPADYGESAAKFHADRGGRKHEGQDLFAKPGTPLVAVRDGIVLDGAGGRNFYSSGGGNTLVIYSPIDDRSYVYLHMLKPPLVKSGEQVHAGQPVGQIGCTGSCFGPHLHFEVRNGRAYWGADTKAIDPLPLLRQWPQRPTG